MPSEISKEYFRQKFDELKQAVNCVATAISAETTASAIETRPICIEQGEGEGCVRVYAIVSVTAEGTTILRVEEADGTEIETYTLTDCICDCVDTYVAPTP